MMILVVVTAVVVMIHDPDPIPQIRPSLECTFEFFMIHLVW